MVATGPTRIADNPKSLAYNTEPALNGVHLTTGRLLPVEIRRDIAMVAPMVDDGEVDGSTIVAADALAWTRAPPFPMRADDELANKERSADLDTDRLSPSRAVADLSAVVPQPDAR
jgi:hypothetical protein